MSQTMLSGVRLVDPTCPAKKLRRFGSENGPTATSSPANHSYRRIRSTRKCSAVKVIESGGSRLIVNGDGEVVFGRSVALESRRHRDPVHYG